jgi:hypothetical protein
VVQSIKTVFIAELLIAGLFFINFSLFINVQIAVISSFLIIIATAYAHKKMVERQVENGVYGDERDVIDKIDDPHGLYDEVEDITEEKDFKTIVKEEKKRVKIFSKESLKQGLKGSFSPWRLGAYMFLVFGFIGLKNNGYLDLWYYMPSLFVGIVLGALVTKRM